ncbi:MAG: hypothetical protein U0326_24120 [Polyangiales bacterium]
MRRSLGFVCPRSPMLQTSPASDPWSVIAAELRASASPWRSAAFARLYDLARAEGPRVLRSFRALDRERRVDLAIDTLVAKAEQIIAADRPRAFFRKALHNDAVSWTRSPRARVDAFPEEAPLHDQGAPDASEASLIYRLDARRRFHALDTRARDVMLAEAVGETREAIGQAAGTSRANVDQIISRARRRHAGDA